MDKIEGFTPGMLWNFVIVLIGLGSIAILVDKVVDIFRKAKDRKNGGLEARVRALEDRDAVIEEMLDRDLNRIENLERRQDDAGDGFAVLGKAVLAILNHQIHNGNGEEMLEAQSELNSYLLKRK